MSFLRQTLRFACSAVLPPSWMLFHGPAGSHGVALTFDDGPHPEHTPAVLDALAEVNARGTFFVVGECAEQHPDLVRRIVDAGHELGHHTWSHSAPEETSAALLTDEVLRTRRLIKDIAGFECNLFRPPRGHLTLSKTLMLWRLKQSIVLWNVDSDDCRTNTAAAALDWVTRWTPRGGDVVLLHDDYAFVPSLIAPLVHRIRGDGLKCVTVSEWLNAASWVGPAASVAAIHRSSARSSVGLRGCAAGPTLPMPLNAD